MVTEVIPEPPVQVQLNTMETRPRPEPPKLVPVNYMPIQPVENTVKTPLTDCTVPNHRPVEPVPNIYPPRAPTSTPISKVKLPPTDTGKFKKRVRKAVPKQRVRKPAQPRAPTPQQSMPVLIPFNAYPAPVYPEHYPQDPVPPVLQPSTGKSYIEL